MMREWSEPTSTQIGAIAENLVGNALIVESKGRLSPFQPVADDDGIDLLIYDKQTGKAIPVQVKCRTVTLKRRGREERGNTVHFEARVATLKTDEFAYLIAVLLSAPLSTIERAWLIPMKQLPSVARKGSTKYVVRANRNSDSKDRFTPFRCASATELTKRIVALFDAEPTR
jgi:hypothetical protein